MSGRWMIEAAARHPRQQLARAGQAAVGRRQAARAAVADHLAVGPDDAAVDERGAFGNVDEEDAGVVQHGAVARLQFDDFRELVLGPRHLRVEHLHAELRLRRESRTRPASRAPRPARARRTIQPVANFGDGGMSAALPRAAPPSTHAAIVSISFCDRLMSLRIGSVWVMSAPQGGISRDTTFALIALAHGRASSYDSSDIGATSPGRWQLAHFLYMIGATSLANVGAPAEAGLEFGRQR